MKSTKVILLSLICLLAIGCGFTDDKPVTNSKIFVPKDLNACTLDTDSFESILEKDIEAQLTCLENKFISFSKYVLTYNRDVISEKELGIFIRQVFKTNTDGIIQGLGILFKVNSLLLRDNFGELSKKNITPLIRMLVTTNRQSVTITKNLDILLNTKDQKQFVQARIDLETALKAFSNGVTQVIKAKDGSNNRVDIEKLLKDIYKQTGTESQESLLFVKKLFLGGKKNTITTREVLLMLEKLPKLIMLAIDMTTMREEFFEDGENFYSILEVQISKMVKLLFNHKKDDILFDVDDILLLTKKLEKEAASIQGNEKVVPIIKDYKVVIKSFKTDILGSPTDNFTYNDVLVQLNLLQFWLNGISLSADFKSIYKEQTNETDPTIIKEIHKKVLKRTLKFKKKIILMRKNKDLIPKKMKLIKFIKILSDEFHSDQPTYIDGTNIDHLAMDGLFSLKKLFVGGTKEILTRDEFFSSLKTLPNLINVFSDFAIRSRSLEDNELYLHLQQSVKRLDGLFLATSDSTKILSINELLAVMQLFSEDQNYLNFKETIQILKTKILDRPGQKEDDIFRISHFKFLTKKIQAIFLRVHYNILGYNFFTDAILSPNKVKSKDLNKYDFFKIKEMSTFNNRKRHSLFIDFKKLLQKQRYFRDIKTGQAYYGPEIKRNLSGFIESTILKEVIEIIINNFGNIKERSSFATINNEELGNLLFDFKPLLQEFGLWTTEPLNFANNTILLTDLFGSQSNGDQEIDLYEGVEYLGLIVQTYQLGGKLMEKLENSCPVIMQEAEKTFSLSCYREKFFETLFSKGLNYQKYFPMLHKFSIDTQDQNELNQFLENIERFARDKDRIGGPMGRRDFTLVIGAILNIESTFIRFDKDSDNNIENEELNNAFLIYKNSIVKISNLWSWASGMSKPIFFYMVNEMMIPSMTSLMYYWTFGDYSDHVDGSIKIEAKRNHIGTLLRYLVELSNEQADSEKKE